MKRTNKLILLPLGIIFISAQAPPRQTSIDDVPSEVVDTLKVDDNTHIITYSNNTWEYYFPYAAEYLAQEVFQTNWVTGEVFSYRKDTFTIPDVTELKLIDDLSDFSPPAIKKVYSGFKQRGRRFHNGVDLSLKKNEPIYATFAGKVRYAKWNSGGFGYLVIIRHENGLETYYAHLARINVAQNEFVKAGQIIGYCGSTGRSRGVHLHFEVRYRDLPFDPERLFDFEQGELKYATFILEKEMLNKYSKDSDTLDDIDIDGALENADTLSSEQILENIELAQTAAERERAAREAELKAMKFHTIKSGDTLGALARKYGTTVTKICNLNNIKSTTILKLGRKLRVR